MLPALMAALLSLPAARCPLPAAAQTVTDGDTIKQGGVIYRLWGIDAPELRQAWLGWSRGAIRMKRRR